MATHGADTPYPIRLPLLTLTHTSISLVFSLSSFFFPAFEKNGTVAYPDLALAFVKAFFIRRDLQGQEMENTLTDALLYDECVYPDSHTFDAS